MYTLDKELHTELTELVEDTVSYFCNEHRISGELTWVIIECLAKAKYEELRGNIT